MIPNDHRLVENFLVLDVSSQDHQPSANRQRPPAASNQNHYIIVQCNYPLITTVIIVI